MSEEYEVLKRESRIRFRCHGDLPCFTQCCRDVNIYLTPYDVLRMRRALDMGSSAFLTRYTRSFLAKVVHVPVVQLLMDEETLSCPFVEPRGCTIYDDRPWACRMYPFDLDGTHTGCYRVIADGGRCVGLREPHVWVLSEWLYTQGVEPYMAMEALYQAVMPPQFEPGKPMDAGLGKLLFLAYDLDVFRAMLANDAFRRVHGVDDETYGEVLRDDEALLKLSFAYIREQMRELYGLM